MPNTTIGNYVPSSNIWDVSEIYSTEVTSPEFKELLVRLYQNLNRMSISLNGRDAGTYSTNEFVNGQQFFPNPAFNSSTMQYPNQRQAYRKVINFGTLPAAGSTTQPHRLDITSGYSFTRIYATASNQTSSFFVPIPYVSTTGDIIQLSVDATNVTISTSGTFNGTAWNTFTIVYVILEYIKS